MNLPYLQPERLIFSTFDDKTLREVSVKCITNPTSLDRVGTPLPGGLYDPALGPHETNEVCCTCKQFSTSCPGHFGHIQLPLPVFNPIYFSYLVSILRSCCFACNRLICKSYESHVLALQLRAIRNGYVACAQSIMELAISIINKSKEAKEQEDISNKAAKDGTTEPEISSAVIEDIKRSTLDMFEATVHAANKDSSDSSSSNEYLMDLLTSQLKMMCSRKTCPHCSAPVRDVISEGNTKIYLKPLASNKIASWDSALKKQPIPEVTKAVPPWHRVSKIVLLTPNSALALLNDVRNIDSLIYNLLFNETPPSTMFYSIICVPPVKFRPISVVNGLKFDNPVSAKLSDILSAAVQLSSLLQEQKSQDVLLTSVDQGEKYQKIQIVWMKCQSEVNQFVVMLRSVLEKKQGLFRMHMMGKRVNYAARSVISPDPYLNCDEVGIPLVFATRLTYPQPVTPWNVLDLRKAVINGPLVYPGATHVEMEDGKRVKLPVDSKTRREAIAKTLLVEDKNRPGYNKKVCRHVINGDALLLNRQPTLHKPSIMAHKARVLTNERTLRLHYSVCKAYNADFDGDEMNAHLPQDEISRAEAYGLMSVSDNYLVPKDGKPLGGLIQDHIVSATLLTQRGRFFNKEEYVYFVYLGLVDAPRRIVLMPPAIMKPQKMWSGKQIITTILRALVPPNKELLTLHGKSSTPEKCWITTKNKNLSVNTDDMLDSEVIFLKGELLSGVIDKGQCGKDFGLVHCVYEIYGGEVATLLLSAFGRLFTSFLSWRGFSLGIEDIIVQSHGEEERNEILASREARGQEIACKVLGVDQPHNLKVAYQQAHLKPVLYKDLPALDRGARQETGSIETDISRACMGMNLRKKFPHNNLQLMVRSGAKGSEVNCTQISCMVGQVELEGARPPLMLSGRSLPSYLPYDPSLSAGGLITSRFLTGIKPQEMYFNSMAGRDGLVDTAVKTSRSGYLQRCLIKHLEGICISYDNTARDSDGSVVQFLYGCDGIDITKSNFLTPSGLKHLKTNSFIMTENNKDEKKLPLNCTDAPALLSDIVSITHPRKRYVSPFNLYEKKMRTKEKFKDLSTNKDSSFRSVQTLAIAKSWYNLKNNKKDIWERKAGPLKPLPVLSTYPPHKYLGSISERLQVDLTVALSKDSNKDKVEKQVYLHSLKALCQPGDGVGVLAGQSIGEPSTQMTLNTFHFAGRAEMNMTMGIPRLREILMTSGANMKTPMMKIPLKADTSKGTAVHLAKMMTEVYLSQVLENVDICETLINEGSSIVQRYKLKFNILPEEYYSDKCYCKPREIMKYMEDIFIGRLQTEFSKLRRAQTSKAALTSDTTPEAEVVAVRDNDSDNDDEREVGGKRSEQSSHINSYEDDVDEDNATEEAAVTENMEDITGDDEPDIREQNIMKRKAIVKYKYDRKSMLWCEVTMDFALSRANIMLSSVVEDLAKRALVWKVPGIKRAFVNTEKDSKGRFVIVTEGINMLEVWKHHEVVDAQDLYTNDINKFCEYYGIEAGMAALITEIQEVFGAYGIKVDARHLTLVADYVTQHGVYRPFNRIGMRDNASPFQKISFETCTEFLRRAAFYNEQDHLKSPSSAIVMGKLGSFGTGACEIRQPIHV